MKTTLKEIKAFPAEDITCCTAEQIDSIRREGLTIIAYSMGTYGKTGLVIMSHQGKLYKITSRSSALFMIM